MFEELLIYVCNY